jgi:SAM-dependent methyltransferase
MSCCSGCSSYSAAEQQFGSAIARRDLQRYRRKGPDASTRVMLEIVASDVHAGASLLDIGGGVGVMSFELLARGVREATLVDASPAYLDAGRSEAERPGVASQLRCVGGDVVGVVGSVAPADVVTMHRVVCCYPEWTSLLARATTLSRHLLALSYPRERWFVRAWMGVDNFRRRIAGHPFRTFLHSTADMEEHIAIAGFERVSRRRTPVWCIDVYARRQTA